MTRSWPLFMAIALSLACTQQESPEPEMETAAPAQPAGSERDDSQDGFFDADGVEIHYTDQGTGDPVIVIHGFAMSISRMESAGVIDGIVDAGYRVLGIDCRGHGQSGKPHDPKQYGEEIPRDVVRLMDHLGFEQAYVVGYSMGAIVTNKVRHLFPDRVRAVVLGGAGWQKEGGTALPGLTGADLAEALERTGDFKWMLRKFTENRTPPATEEEIDERNARMMEGNDPAALAAVLRAWDGFAVPEQDLRQNQVPTLAVVGENDPLRVKVNALQEVMQKLKVVVIPDADHGALSSPLFVEEVSAFLAAHPINAAQAAEAESSDTM